MKFHYPELLHGGDYNPEQWLEQKDTIWKQDMLYAREAGINTLSVGIFSWAYLEPEDGVYDFSWMDEVMDNLAANGIKAVLATPSGARPAWLAKKYPSVLRMTAQRQPNLFGGRHNACYSSPDYERKVTEINTRLAQRYKDHPALLMWHVSNEYNNECHCPRCQQHFRDWCKARYGTIDNLNRAWWNSFWSHKYTSWDEIISPSPLGEGENVAHLLAWQRFCSDHLVRFFQTEIAPLRRITPNVPVTTNLMGTFPGLDYFALGRAMDIASWDNYPAWTGDERDVDAARISAFRHDLMRGVCDQKPFLMMESSPSAVNWHTVNPLRKPGTVTYQGLQAVAHGSDTVQYFQFRKGRGSFEKFHGAVVSHDEREDNRVYREVCGVGEKLSRLCAVLGSAPENRVAVIYDWENRWALDDARFGLNEDKGYELAVRAHHAALMRAGYGVDVIDQTCDLSGYRVVCGPMTYMLRPGFAERVRAFVEGGGTYVSTYCSGWVNEEDLCFMGGFPGPLRDVFGLWDEETDALDATQHNRFTWNGKTYEAKDFCALVHPQGAQVLATYEERFYAGSPALTRNAFGKGCCYYVAARTGEDFLIDLYAHVTKEAGLTPLLDDVPYGVLLAERVGENGRFLFVMNTVPEARTVVLPACTDAMTGEARGGETALPPYGVIAVRR